MDPVRRPCGRRTGPARESQMFFISCGIRTGPVRDPQACRTAPLRARQGMDTTRILQKSRTGVVCGRTGPGPYRPRPRARFLFKTAR